eukprot:2082302-Pyramimonas_sp.AAC.5
MSPAWAHLAWDSEARRGPQEGSEWAPRDYFGALSRPPRAPPGASPRTRNSDPNPPRTSERCGGRDASVRPRRPRVDGSAGLSLVRVLGDERFEPGRY